MARALSEDTDMVVIDEFTSVVDRQVAQVASHTVQKAVRRTPGRQFVAVTCHYDVTDWLQPDWVYDVAAGAEVGSTPPQARLRDSSGRSVHLARVCTAPLSER
jgi:ABC-type ATPase with predicted acetyltransferase domain